MKSQDGQTERTPPRFTAARQQLRKLEWHLPVSVQTPLLRLFGGYFDPYTERDDATRSIFVHIPRTGGTSVGIAIHSRKAHFPLSRYAAFDRDRFERYFKFGFVRNPWDRLLSAYTYLRAGADKPFPFEDTLWARKHLTRFDGFEGFVLAMKDPQVRREIMSYIHFRPQLSWVSLPGSNRVELDFVGRFERIDEDFSALAERLSLDAPLPKTNASKRGSYKDAYTPEMRDIAAELYRADIEAFGYEF